MPDRSASDQAEDPEREDAPVAGPVLAGLGQPERDGAEAAGGAAGEDAQRPALGPARDAVAPGQGGPRVPPPRLFRPDVPRRDQEPQPHARRARQDRRHPQRIPDARRAGRSHEITNSIRTEWRPV